MLLSPFGIAGATESSSAWPSLLAVAASGCLEPRPRSPPSPHEPIGSCGGDRVLHAHRGHRPWRGRPRRTGLVAAAFGTVLVMAGAYATSRNEPVGLQKPAYGCDLAR